MKALKAIVSVIEKTPVPRFTFTRAACVVIAAQVAYVGYGDIRNRFTQAAAPQRGERSEILRDVHVPPFQPAKQDNSIEISREHVACAPERILPSMMLDCSGPVLLGVTFKDGTSLKFENSPINPQDLVCRGSYNCRDVREDERPDFDRWRAAYATPAP